MKALMNKLDFNTTNILPKTVIYLLGVIVFFAYWHFFGAGNAIIAFLTGNAATMLFHKDLTTNPVRNIFKFIFIYLFIGICSYLASLNIYLGFAVNFISIFFMVYALFYDFKTTILPPFLLSYLILLKHQVSIDQLPLRLLCLSIGALFLILSQVIINHNRSRNGLRANLVGLVKEITKKIDLLIDNKDIKYNDTNVEKHIDKILSIINERKDNCFCINTVDNLRLNFALCIERINYSLDELSNPSDDESYKKFLKDLTIVIDKIIKVIETDDAIYLLTLEIDEFINKYESLLSFNYSAYEIIQNIDMLKFSLINLEKEKCTTKSKLKYFIPIPTNMTELKNIILLNFNFKSLKFTYAFRLALLISASYFVVKLFNIPFGYWIAVTLFTVIQPYAETAKQRFFLRFRGIILGILIFMTITLFIPNLTIKILLYFLLYYAYLFINGYDKKMACVTPVVLGIFALLGTSAYETSFYRLIYTIIGIVIGYLGTKYLFPYSTLDSLKNFSKDYFNLSKDTISYAFKSKIDEDLFKELDDRLIKGKLYEDKILLNNSNNNISCIKDFTYNQRILMNNIYFLFYSLYEAPFDGKVLDQFKEDLNNMYKTYSRNHIDYDEETYLRELRIRNRKNFKAVDSYQGKLILINLSRIYSRIEISYSLIERIKLIIFAYYS